MPSWPRAVLAFAAACLLANASAPGSTSDSGEAACAELVEETTTDEDLSQDVSSLLQLGLSTSTAEARRVALAQKASSRSPPAAEKAASANATAADLTSAAAGNASAKSMALRAQRQALNASVQKAAAQGVALNASALKASSLKAAARGQASNASALKAVSLKAAVRGQALNASALNALTQKAAVRGQALNASALKASSLKAAVRGQALNASALNALAQKAAVRGQALNASALKASSLEAAVQGQALNTSALDASAPVLSMDEVVEPREAIDGIEAIPFLHLVNSTYEVQASTEEKGGGGVSRGWIMFFVGLFLPIAVYVVYVVIGCCCARSLGKAIEFGIETYDTATLGVDVEIGKLLVNPFEGVVIVDGLTIDNPKGYKSDYLLQAKSVEVDFDMKAWVLSGFTHVVVEKVALKRVDIIYEKTWSSSNVHDVLAFLEGDTSQPQPQHQCLPPMEKKDDKEKKEEEKKKAEQERKKKRKKEEEEALHLEVRDVLVEDVGMRLQGQMIGGHGARLAIADIKYENFSKEAGSAYLDDVLKVLFKSVMKTVVANVVGRRTAEWCM